jgi:HAD superfamily hydrolase (TIGR01549 family)
MAVLFDLDQTLINSISLHALRMAGKWAEVFKMIPNMKPYEGISELLVELNKRGIPVCIITSSLRSYCERVINHWGWKIDASVCYHDTTYHKPHCEPIIEGLSMLGVTADKTIAVGDDARDIIAAKRAGVFTVGALWGAADRNAYWQHNLT